MPPQTIFHKTEHSDNDSKFAQDIRRLNHHGFKLKKKLGEGAYGCVYAAEEIGTGQQLAVKRIENVFSRLSVCKHTFREIRLLQALNHKNIIKLRDILVDQGSQLDNFHDKISSKLKSQTENIYLLFDIMYADLSTIIRSPQHLSEQHCKFFMYQVLQAVVYMHRVGVIHRDLKPRNILVNRNCDLSICDFGLARQTCPNNSEDFEHMTDYVATRWYRAPEVIIGSERYDKPLDMFSIGCILAELILRKPIFPGANKYDMLVRVAQVLGPPPEKMISDAKSNKMRLFLSDLVGYYPNPIKPIESMLQKCEPNAIDLLKNLLTWDPKKRFVAETALRHPYLAEFYRKKDDKHDVKKLASHDLTLYRDQAMSIENYRALIESHINCFRKTQELNQ